MEVSAVKQDIKKKQLRSYYIFTGTEWMVQKIYIDQIAKICSNSRPVYIDSIADIYPRLKNRSFFDKPTCYVIRDDKLLLTDEHLQEQMNHKFLCDNVVILLISVLDKRTKFYKTYKDTIVEFTPLTKQILTKYIKQEIDLSDRNCDILIDICENDYGRCLLEIDKIKRYVEGNPTLIRNVDNNAFEMLLKEGTIYEPPYDAIFDFVDAFLKRNINKSFDLLKQAYDAGEATFVFLSVLYDNAKAVLQVQSCDSSNISQTTGLTNWQIKNAKERIGYYTNEELVRLLKLIQRCESGIKKGTIDDNVVMEYIMVNVL